MLFYKVVSDALLDEFPTMEQWFTAKAQAMSKAKACAKAGYSVELCVVEVDPPLNMQKALAMLNHEDFAKSSEVLQKFTARAIV